MKKWIFFGIGLAVGAGIGVLSVRGYYRKLAFDEINEVRDIYRKKTAAKEAVDRNYELKKQFLEENKETETGKTATKEDKATSFTRYSELREPYSGGESMHFNVFRNPPDADELELSDDDPYELAVNRTGPRDENQEPYEITEEEFASEKMFYDKVMIEYYRDGVAVLEDTGQIIESIEELIGPDILPLLDQEGEAYIRNNGRSTDYGILFLDTDFVSEEGPD